MAWASLYKRILPSPPAIELAATQGKVIFCLLFKILGFFQLSSIMQI